MSESIGADANISQTIDCGPFKGSKDTKFMLMSPWGALYTLNDRADAILVRNILNANEVGAKGWRAYETVTVVEERELK